MKKIILPTLALLALAANASAAVIVSESFDYSLGSQPDNTLSGGTGWGQNWQGGAGVDIVAPLSAPPTNLNTTALGYTGNALQGALFGIVTRNLATPITLTQLPNPNDAYYYSFLFQLTALPTAARSFGLINQFGSPLGTVDTAGVVTLGSGNFTTTLGTTYLIAGSMYNDFIGFGSNLKLTANVYSGNDAITSSTPGSYSYTIPGTGLFDNFGQVNSFGINSAGSGAENIRLDELRIGTTWGDVVQVIPEPSTYAMLLGGIGALALLRRRSKK